jgi:hypothetical protein
METQGFSTLHGEIVENPMKSPTVFEERKTAAGKGPFGCGAFAGLGSCRVH